MSVGVEDFGNLQSCSEFSESQLPMYCIYFLIGVLFKFGLNPNILEFVSMYFS